MAAVIVIAIGLPSQSPPERRIKYLTALLIKATNTFFNRRRNALLDGQPASCAHQKSQRLSKLKELDTLSGKGGINAIGHNYSPSVPGEHVRFSQSDQLQATNLPARTRQPLWNAATLFSWQASDLLIVGHFLVAHGRCAFTSKPTIRVASG